MKPGDRVLVDGQTGVHIVIEIHQDAAMAWVQRWGAKRCGITKLSSLTPAPDLQENEPIDVDLEAQRKIKRDSMRRTRLRALGAEIPKRPFGMKVGSKLSDEHKRRARAGRWGE